MDGEDLRLAVYRAFAATGHAPQADELAAQLGAEVTAVAEGCAADWLASTGSDRGYVMSLGTLWRFAAHWYDGRLERGYTRREPSQATEYLREVGLTGPFWDS